MWHVYIYMYILYNISAHKGLKVFPDLIVYANSAYWVDPDQAATEVSQHTEG
jgi:hypothetical protein